MSLISPSVRRAPFAASRPFSREDRTHVAQHAGFHILRQFRIVGEQHLTVRLEQHDIPLGGGHTGIAVKCDVVGAQHVIVLPGLDMALGDHQRILPVVLHLIGGEGDRLIAPAG